MIRPHARSAPRAFTLFELAIVVAILGVVAAIAIPRFAGATTRYRLDLAVDRVEGDAVLAAEWARSAGRAHVMTFDIAGEGYTIASGADGAGGTRAEVLLGGEPYRCDLQSVSIVGGGNKLVFDGYGRPTAGASLVLRLGDESRTVVLSDPVTRPADGGVNLEVITPATLPTDLVPDIAADLIGGKGVKP